jgi:hypothetical protein
VTGQILNCGGCGAFIQATPWRIVETISIKCSDCGHQNTFYPDSERCGGTSPAPSSGGQTTDRTGIPAESTAVSGLET